MPSTRLFAALLACSLAAPAAALEPAALPKPADIQSIAIHPAKLALKGADDAAQVVVTATLTDGKTQDLTHDVKFTVADGKTAAVSNIGRVTPLANGTSEVVATFGDKTARAPVEAKQFGENLPLNFANQVVPVFT